MTDTLREELVDRVKRRSVLRAELDAARNRVKDLRTELETLRVEIEGIEIDAANGQARLPLDGAENPTRAVAANKKGSRVRTVSIRTQVDAIEGLSGDGSKTRICDECGTAFPTWEPACCPSCASATYQSAVVYLGKPQGAADPAPKRRRGKRDRDEVALAFQGEGQ